MMPLSAAPGLRPPNETERLRTLHQYDTLPMQHEPIFDALVGLTTQIFSVPVSLIALVDAEEVAYKANQGLPGLRQQPREEAICALVVSQQMPLVFTNLTRPDQLQRLPNAASMAAQAKNLQFYAGAPLRTPVHHLLGTLCVIGYQPRSFGDPEQQLLAQLARVVSELLLIRHICLTHEKITQRERWQALQALLVEEVRQLSALGHYLLTQFGTQVPVPLGVLRPIARRLDDLHGLLQHHHPGPMWCAPTSGARAARVAPKLP